MTAASATPAHTVGLFGLGNMGAAIATRLRALGPVLAYEPDARRARHVADDQDLELADGAADMADLDVVVLSLPTPSVSRQVVASLIGSLSPGSLIVETSTINPTDVRSLQELCAPAAVRLVDAAILSGVEQMRQGSSMLLIGGEDEDVALAQPALDAMTPRQQRFGPLGSGMAAKVINNAVAHAVMVVLTEAGAMASATGVRRADLARLLAGADGGLTRPLTHRFVERILEGDYEGGMSTEAARKDSTLALELAQASQTPLFAVQAAHTVYELATSEGMGRFDYAAIAMLWEGWTGRPFADTDEGEPHAGDR